MSERPPIVDLHIAGVGAAQLVRSDEHSLRYRAPHETRGHEVDIEILPGSQGEAARERFAREQQALGRLAGVEGVVPLLEAGVTIDGDLYLMTPTLGGRTLAEIIETDGPMAWPEATRIIEAAAATLHHAHVVGVTHRRIDPDTIVVTDDGRVLLTGLGCAGLTMDAAGSSLPAVDRPGYRAPELSGAAPSGADPVASAGTDADADPIDAGPAGDIYGLGATLWALLAGRRPFTGADGDGDDEPKAIVERAATLRVGDLRSVAPASVAEAVEWATTIEPERRPSSAATFARALREAAARAPSGFIADPGAVIAGWQPLTDPDDYGAPDQRPTAGPAGGDADGTATRSGLAAAVAASGLAGVTVPAEPAPADSRARATKSIFGDHDGDAAPVGSAPVDDDRSDDAVAAGVVAGAAGAVAGASPAGASPAGAAAAGRQPGSSASGSSASAGDNRATIQSTPVPAAALAVPRQTTLLAGGGDEASDGSDDGRRAGLLVGLGIAAIALVALAASAVMMAFVDEADPVTISGPSIEPGEDDVPAEVLGVEVEAEPGSADDRLTAGAGRDGDAAGDDADAATDDAGDGDAPVDGDDASPGQSALIEPFLIPTPTPAATTPPASGAAVAGPTQPPASPAATATPTPGTTISAPPPPSPRPTPTPTPETIISAPPAPPPAPTSSPTPMPTIAPAPSPTPAPTPTSAPPTPTPDPPPPTPTTDPVGVIETPN